MLHCAGNCPPFQYVILSEITVLNFVMLETLIRRFHGPKNSIAGDIQLQRFRAWTDGISATPFRGAFMGLRN